VPHSSKATYGGTVYSDTELMAVLMNPASGGGGVLVSPVLVQEWLRG
jgi:hypothetical protein